MHLIKDKNSGNYAVYDLGGGTFDISIIKVVGQDIEISSNGIEKCEDDFDKAVFEIVSERYLKQQEGVRR